MKICTTSLLLKNILLHEKKPDIGNGVEPSEQKNCPEGSTRWPSAQYFRPILQVIYQSSLQRTFRQKNEPNDKNYTIFSRKVLGFTWSIRSGHEPLDVVISFPLGVVLGLLLSLKGRPFTTDHCKRATPPSFRVYKVYRLICCLPRDRIREDSDGTVCIALNGAIRDAIPEAGERLDHLRLSELASQPADGDLHGLGERIRVLIPHLLKEILRAEGSRCRPHEGL